MAQSAVTPPQPSTPQRVIASVGFIVLTLAAGWMLLSGLSMYETYAFIIGTLMMVTYLLAIPSFLLVIFGTSRSRILGVGVRVSALLACLVVLPFVISSLQDPATSSNGTAQFLFLFVLFLPWIFIPLTSIVAIILACGLVDEIRVNRKSAERNLR